MGFFDFFTKKTPKSENERTYYPGGRTFGIKLTYDPDADKLSYIGRYSIRGSFTGADVTNVAVNAISNTHGVVMLHGGDEVLFTSDILPLSVCKAAQEWLLVRGEGYITQPNGDVIKPESAGSAPGPVISQAQEAEAVTAPVETASVEAPAAPQATEQSQPEPQTLAQGDPFEELKKLKELADLGIITAEEYEAKRQKLLERI